VEGLFYSMDDEGVLMLEIRNCGSSSRCMKHAQNGVGWSTIKCLERGGVNGGVVQSVVP